jgi:hypothetical protein
MDDGLQDGSRFVEDRPMQKTDSNRSNAARAAKAAGLADFVLAETDGRWSFIAKPEPVAVVALATADEDLGLVPEARAMLIAIKHAARTGETVTVRDAVTDAVLETAEPPKAEVSNGSGCSRTRRAPGTPTAGATTSTSRRMAGQRPTGWRSLPP